MVDGIPAPGEVRWPGAPPQLSEPDLVQKLRNWYRDARSHFADWYDEARECYDFVAGEQWNTDDVQTLEEEDRPAIVFNRIAPVIDVVAGTEVSNRQETRYLPREQGDVGVNEMLTGAAAWARDNCDAEDEESDAFLDMVICGMGWANTRMDYELDEDGMVFIERTDPLTKYWDPKAKKKNLTDRRYDFTITMMPLNEMIELYPDRAEELERTVQWSEDEELGEPHDAFNAKFYTADQGPTDIQEARVPLIEAQWWERETFYRVLDAESGKIVPMPAERWAKVKRMYEEIGERVPRALKQRRRVYYRAFIVGDVLLEKEPCPGNSFTYKAMTAKRDRNKNYWFGLVRAMKDPQRWANKWLSQTMHILNSNAMGGIIAEKDAFEDHREIEENWSRPDTVHWAKKGAISQKKIMPKPQGQFPAGFDRLMTFAVSSIRDVSGVNLEMLGLAERDQPGILEFQRKQAGITILSSMFDSLRKYRKEQGRLLLTFIQDFLSDGRLIKISGPGKERYVPLVRQDDTVTYDVIVDEAPSSPNQKERVWQILVEMMPMMTSLNIPPSAWLEMLKYSPLPETVTNAIEEALANAQQEKSPEDQKTEAEAAKIQAQGQTEQARAQELSTQAILNIAKARSEGSSANETDVDAAIKLRNPDPQAQVQ